MQYNSMLKQIIILLMQYHPLVALYQTHHRAIAFLDVLLLYYLHTIYENEH